MNMTGNHDEKFLGLTKFQFLIALVGLVALLSMLNGFTLVYAVRANQARIADAKEISDANLERDCNQKAYAQGQVENTSNFLAEHPGAEPIPGISRAQLVEQLKRQRAFRDTFGDLNCSERQ